MEGRGAMSSAESVVISVASEGDEGAIARVWAECFPHDPPRNEPVSMARRKLAQRDGLVWVAREGERAVGAVAAGYDGVRGWLYHLGVVPSHRGRGLARALVGEVIRELAARGCIKVNLQIREGRDELVGFYESLGFEVDPARSMGRTL